MSFSTTEPKDMLKGKVDKRIVNFLEKRGIEDINCFLFSDFRCYHDPFLLPEMEKGVDRIVKALKNKEKILIWGHDDLDGISSVALLKGALINLGADEENIFYYIPDRKEEKYGLSKRVIENFHRRGVTLVVTVDTGSSSGEEVLHAKNMGVSVIITDHHEVLKFPSGYEAFINPKRRDSVYPFRNLAGVGVTFKLVTALYRKIAEITEEELFSLKPEFFGFTALGTIADRVPLLSENRYLVKDAMYVLSEGDYIPFKVWRKKAGFSFPLTVAEIFQKGIQYFYSAGKDEGVLLLLSDDEKKLEEIYDKLQIKIGEWNIKKEEMCGYAEESAEVYGNIVVTVDPRIDVKFLGSCAGRLRDKFSLPAFAITVKKERKEWVGEVRGPEGTDVLSLLDRLGYLFKDYGGHRLACGFSIEEKNLEQLMKKLEEIGEEFELPERKNKEYEMVIPIKELPQEMRFLLPPYGPGFPPPILFSPDTCLRKENHEFTADGQTVQFQTILPEKENFKADLIYTFDELGNIIITYYREVK